MVVVARIPSWVRKSLYTENVDGTQNKEKQWIIKMDTFKNGQPENVKHTTHFLPAIVVLGSSVFFNCNKAEIGLS